MIGYNCLKPNWLLIQTNELNQMLVCIFLSFCSYFTYFVYLCL